MVACIQILDRRKTVLSSSFLHLRSVGHLTESQVALMRVERPTVAIHAVLSQAQKLCICIRKPRDSTTSWQRKVKYDTVAPAEAAV